MIQLYFANIWKIFWIPQLFAQKSVYIFMAKSSRESIFIWQWDGEGLEYIHIHSQNIFLYLVLFFSLSFECGNKIRLSHRHFALFISYAYNFMLIFTLNSSEEQIYVYYSHKEKVALYDQLDSFLGSHAFNICETGSAFIHLANRCQPSQQIYQHLDDSQTPYRDVKELSLFSISYRFALK